VSLPCGNWPSGVSRVSDGTGSAAIATLGLTVDLRTEPWRYPGPFLPFSCLQIGDQLRPLHPASDGDLTVVADGRQVDLVSLLRKDHGVVLSECHFVVAIGSNASPDVLRRKLARRNVSTTVAQIVGRLDGFSIGYSAHVSPAGYVPAAPYPRSRSSTDIVVAVLTEEQLRCIDETEPNYDRTTVPGQLIRLALPLPLPPIVFIYESKWGVLVGAAGEPLPFGTQEAIFPRLAAWQALPPWITIDDGIPAITSALGGNAESREWITARLAPYASRPAAG
jgi:hypothetical protein